MDKSLFGFIWRFSKRQQIVILIITVMSFPILYMTLELPKWIINQAIGGTDFPVDVFGFQLDQIPYLFFLCFVFLGLVVLNNGFKYVLNIYKGVTGERMLRRLRYVLYMQILRFKLPHFRRVSSSELIPMITAETEDVGVFIGEAIATPAFQGGTLLVYVAFIFMQDPFLGAAAISLYPLQAYVIPRLQQKVIRLTRERVKNVRKISDRIGEAVGGVVEIHANDTSRWHLADLSDRLFVNYKLRLEIYKRKFMIKFLNNFLNQLPPFFFYSVGGYLVIQGNLSFGSLVAVLAAYKDLASPWKELLQWYQTMSSVKVKYETVVENFDPEDAWPLERLEEPDGEVRLPSGDLVLSSVTAQAGGSGQEIFDVSLRVAEGSRIAVYGPDGSGRTELLLAMAGILHSVAGRVDIGGEPIESFREAALGRAISFVSADPFVFNDTIRGNVVYALQTRPTGEPTLEASERRFRQLEATLTGNSLHEVTAPWEDLSTAGVETREALDERLLELFQLVGMGDDLYRLGLQSRLEGDTHPSLVERILEARVRVAQTIASDGEIQNLVTLWDAKTFNDSATLAENVLFALPADPAVRIGDIPRDPDVLALLKKVGLADDLVDIGARVAGTMIELFSGMDAGSTLIGDYSFLSAEDTPAFEARLKKLATSGRGALSADETADFIGLAFRVVPGRHRLVELSGDLVDRIIAARPDVQAGLQAIDGRYALFDRKRFVAPMTIEENILFGKPRVDRRGASSRIDTFVRTVLADLGLRGPISLAGLDFEVGVQGSRLSASQRRRIGLARALIKRPSYLIVDTVLDAEPDVLDRVLDVTEGATVVVGTHLESVAERIGHVAVMLDGRLVADGSYASVLGRRRRGEPRPDAPSDAPEPEPALK